MIEEIIDYLNSVANSDYSPNDHRTIDALNQLIKEGYSHF